MKTLFLTLRTFSATGGIEKVCKILGKALYEDSMQNAGVVQICSMYDQQSDAFDNPYFPGEIFRGYGINRVLFSKDTIQKGSRSDVVVVSHINLLLIGWLIKKKSPHTKIVLLAHGIEIWYPLSWAKRKMLHSCDSILAVSHYTKHKLIEVHSLPEKKCMVFNNCLDPFLPRPSVLKKDPVLLSKYGLKETHIVLMTLTRLSSKERYKGYDKVIRAVSELKEEFPGIRYFIAGSSDKSEKAHVNKVIQSLRVQNNIIMPGFISDDDLEVHFAMADLYVMPSQKEGFGIVFIEAMYYGLPVIAGNKDGSVDALCAGRLGVLVDPADQSEITAAIRKIVQNKQGFLPDHSLLLSNFSYETYKKNLQHILEKLKN